MVQPCAAALSLSLSLSIETRRRNKDKGEKKRRREKKKREVLPRSRIALFSSCTLSTRHHIRTHTREHRANTYTHPVRIVPHSKSSQGPQPVPSPSASPFFPSTSSSPFTRPSASFWCPTRGLPVKAVEIWFTYVIRVSQPPACFHRNWTVH